VVTATHHKPLNTRHPRIADYTALRLETADAGTRLISA
jgi:hypothetical protein